MFAIARNLILHLRPISRSARLWAAGVGTAACALLIVAAGLTPEPAGLGTHQQLGLPPCNMVLITGLPCPTCGMTTAFAYTVRGRLLSAVIAQPAGTALALGVIAAAIASWTMVITGIGWRPRPGTKLWSRLILGFALLATASWVYKIILVVNSPGGRSTFR